MKKLALVVACGGLAFGVLTAVGLGSGSDGVTAPGPDRELTVERVSSPTFGKVAAKRGAGGPKLAYYETPRDDPIVIDPLETDGGTLSCPRHWHPLSGYFGTDSETLLVVYDAVDSRRAWRIMARNFSGSATVEAFFGVVCVKGIGLA
jgi:hypothetical protein